MAEDERPIERPTILDFGGKNVTIIREGKTVSTNDEHAIRRAAREIFSPKDSDQ